MIRVLALVLCLATPAVAQNVPSSPFSTAIIVNGVGISHYHIDQAIRMNQALTDDRDPRAQAERMLISDTLYMQEAARLEIKVLDREVREGMAEYAARSNLTVEEFVQALNRNGVQAETFESFVRAGLAWRKVISNLYSTWVQQIAASEVEELVEFQPSEAIEQINLSEIVLPANSSVRQEANAKARQIKETITTSEAFSAEAKSVSRAESRDNGGRIGWIPMSQIPPAMHSTLRTTSLGTVSEPVFLNDFLYIFFVHNYRSQASGIQPAAIDYATLTVAAASPQEADSLANSLAANTANCALLRRAAADFADDAFNRRVVLSTSTDYALIPRELENLDNNEIAVRKEVSGRPAARQLIMLCDRIFIRDREVLADLISRVRLAKLESYSNRHLSELRANANIIRK
ncbi:MAG: SurA N-terminal domain-containing protein [Rhodobacteraceae bacterium]|nr:SurA N-terminal domain-containing protein [Paracoccaceae bacterium]